MKEQYQEYINYMAPKWSPASTRSESQRLNKLWPVIDGDPSRLWDAMQDLHPNTRCTYWTRVCAFWDWRIKKKALPGPNPYAEFRAENPRCFRGKYVQKPCEKSVEELRADIERIPGTHADVRNKLLQLLEGGLRRSESYTLTADGYVTGKGGKLRKAYVSEYGAMAGPQRYSTLLRICKEYAGVTPHKLRSARLTRVADNGGNMNELMKFAGWSSPGPAASYVNVREERVRQLAKDSIVVEKKTEQAQSLLMSVLGWAMAKNAERVQ